MSEPLPVLLWHLGRRGGGPRYTHELAAALRHCAGLEPHLCLSRQSEFFTRTSALGLPTLAVDTYTGPASFAAATLRLPAVARRLGDYLRTRRIAVALCTMSHLWNPVLMRTIRSAGVRSLLVVHDAQAHPGDDWGVRSLMLRDEFALADGIVALTEAVRGRLLRNTGYPAERTWVVPHGSFSFAWPDGSLPRPRRLPLDRAARVLFFGRILPYKGLPLLVEAVELLRRQGHRLVLRVVGNGDLGRLALPPDTELVNRWIAEEDIVRHFVDVDAIVLPYIEASQSGVLAISNALGIPAVVTPVGGLPEQIEDGRSGFVAASVDAQAVAEAMARLLFQDPETYAAASAAALDFAERHCSWDTIARSIGDILLAAAPRHVAV